MRLGTKLYLSFGIVLGLGALVASLLVLNTQRLASSYQRLVDHDRRVTELLLQMDADKLQISDALRGWMLHPYGDFGQQEQQRKQSAEERLSRIYQELSELGQADAKLGQSVATIQTFDEQRLRPLEASFLDLVSRQESAAAEELYFNQYLPARYEQEQVIEQVSAERNAQMLATVQASRQSSNRTLGIGVALMLALVAIGAGLSYYLAQHTFSQPIGQLTTAARAISQGDFTQPLKLERPDELGVMAEAFNQMVHRLRRSNESLEEQLKRTHEAKQRLGEMQSQLVQREKMASLGQLVAGVAHELNNPIGFVYSNSLFLEESVEKMKRLLAFYDAHQCAELDAAALNELKSEIEYDYLPTDLVEAIKDCRDGAGRVRDIVQNLRTFSRLDEAELKAVNIAEGIESTLRLLNQYYRNGRITVHRDFGEMEPVNCYAGQLNQVWMNLLANAAQAMGGTGEVWIRAHQHEDQIQVEIRDSGPGIPSEIRDKIFDPFFTTKAVGEGTGLGLSICHGIVAKHGGTISVESELGQGATFTITLPVFAHSAETAAVVERSNDAGFVKVETGGGSQPHTAQI